MSDLLANDFRETDPKTDPDGGSTSFNALAFSTLLSSQETDAHHHETRVSHPGLISLFLFDHHCGDLCKLPEMIFPVKSAVPIKSGRSSLYALPGSHYLLAPPGGALPSLPVPGSAPVRARRFHGDVLLAAPWARSRRQAPLVASVRRSGARIAPSSTTAAHARGARQAEPRSVRTTEFDLELGVGHAQQQEAGRVEAHRTLAVLRIGAWWPRTARPSCARTPGSGSPRTPRTANPPSPRCKSARSPR